MRFTWSGGPSHHIARSYHHGCQFDSSCVDNLLKVMLGARSLHIAHIPELIVWHVWL